ncbi:hypothetical protein NMG60_11005159 [Bertholletia excelsa]
MTVEEIKGVSGVDNDNFPVGMRVLAVDDDRTCLKLLDGLLRKCRYQVTSTNQAKTALKMLRENKNRFDLVISDVHMPDMDGFKLLELVGLEMDLPVITCDYLVKPVRIEELRNVWQHVVRRKKSELKHQSKSSTQDKAYYENEGGEGPAAARTDNEGRGGRRRKQKENEDSAAQKKPRVVWSIELHRKFVAAVNELGIEKAVPKRILDLMNIEGLTRENKYRLYLKRIGSITTQQANIIPAFGVKDSTYTCMNLHNGLGDFQKLAGPGRLPNSLLPSYQSLFPMLELEKLRQNNCNSNVTHLNSSDNATNFIPESTSTDFNVAVDSSNTSITINPLGLQQTHSGGVFSNQSASEVASFNSNSLLGSSRFYDNWQNTIQQSKFSSNGFGDNNLSTGLHIQSSPLDFSSGNAISGPTMDSRGVIQNMDYTQNSDHIIGNLDSIVPSIGVMGLLSQSLDQSNGLCNRKNRSSLANQSNTTASTVLQPSEIEKSTADSKMWLNRDYNLEQTKSQGAFVHSGLNAFDDLMNVMVKREQDGAMLLDGEFGCDAYPFGSCLQDPYIF